MRREYKGFYIESAGGGTGKSRNGYALYHVVTGNCGGSVPTIQAAKEVINDIHQDVREYARYAGCDPVNLTRKRGRFVTDTRSILPKPR